MTSASLNDHRPSPSPAPRAGRGEQSRLRLKPTGPISGFVDGGWWPRSRDLSAELPVLLAGVAADLGRVERVSYHLSDWQPAARKIAVDGAVVRLAGYVSQRPDTIELIAAARRLTLLVVPPDATAGTADSALQSAGRSGNTDAVADLLDAAAADPETAGRTSPSPTSASKDGS